MLIPSFTLLIFLLFYVPDLFQLNASGRPLRPLRLQLLHGFYEVLHEAYISMY